MRSKDVDEIVADWLEVHGFDGLYNGDWQCACLLSDLAPCGELRGDCTAGYRTDGCAGDCDTGGCDFHVGPTREKPPCSSDS